jgi:hypothetical protein
VTYYDQLSERDLLLSAWQALRRIEESLSARLEVPAPVVTVAPPDLTDVVTAVQSLNGTGPTAEDIARAIRDVLSPTPPQAGTEALSEVARALEKLDFRLRGMGTQAYGGGSVSFAPGQAEAFASAVNASSDTTTVTALAATTTPFTLYPASAARVAATVYVEPASSNLFIKFGEGATLDSYSSRLGPGDYWESSPPRHTGVATAVWDGTNGRALLTEFLVAS